MKENEKDNGNSNRNHSSPVLMAFVAVMPAGAEGSAFLSGSVFADTNASGIWEPGEVTLANATVHLTSIADSAVKFTIGADATATTSCRTFLTASTLPGQSMPKKVVSPLRTRRTG